VFPPGSGEPGNGGLAAGITVLLPGTGGVEPGSRLVNVEVAPGPTWVRSGGDVTMFCSIPRHGTPGVAGAGTDKSADATGLRAVTDQNIPAVTTAPIADRFVVRDICFPTYLCAGASWANVSVCCICSSVKCSSYRTVAEERRSSYPTETCSTGRWSR
jgi:hypothetical protein